MKHTDVPSPRTTSSEARPSAPTPRRVSSAKPRLRVALAALAMATGALAAALAFLACGPEGFDPASKVTGTRILAARLDKPYPKPGETVSIELLVHPGPDGGPQAKVYWIPIVCVNPPQDLYYACFAQFAGQSVPGAGKPIVVLPGDAGSVSVGDLPPGVPSGFGGLEAGTDLTPFLSEGSSFSFRVPDDIVTSRPPTPGAPAPYGLAFAFNIACTGRVKLVEIDASARSFQSVPLGCFDEKDQPVGPEGYVFGFSRVYSYGDVTNQNPVIESVTVDGQPIDYAAGITLPRCTTKDVRDCPKHPIQVVVDPSQQESGPDFEGGTRKEQVWASFFVTDGRFDGDIRVLYDPQTGRLENTQNDYQPPQAPGEHTMWIVLHDDRNGASWVKFPVRVP